MPSEKDIAKKQAEIVGQLQQLPIGRTNSGGRAGGTVEVVITNPLPGQPRVVQAKCANDCAPGDVQLMRVDDGSYVALSPTAAVKTSETTTRQVSKKESIKPQKDKDIWAVTSCFLYSKLSETQEDLTDNMATDLTSYDAWQTVFVQNSPTNERVVLFTQRSDTMGDYETAEDALANNLKEDRKLKPGNTGAGGGGAADDAAWGSGSADAVRVWFYIGDSTYLENIATTSKIFNVSGPPSHPFINGVTNDGPGYCLVIRGGGLAYSAIFPYEPIGVGPLTKQLTNQFPDLGGKIGYWGGIAKWRGIQDYTAGLPPVSYFRDGPRNTETYQEPTSFPPSYNPATDTNPWLQINSDWFQFGWGTDANPMYIGCICSTHVNVEPSVIDGISCGDTIPSESWYWGGSASPYHAVLDKYIQGWDGRSNVMYVCWEGHRDNIGLAQSFFEAFRVYWGLPGNVTQLASCGRYGCPIPAPGGGSNYPPSPPGLRRFLVTQLGRKAEIFLKVCEKDYPPIEIKLPFEFAALITKFVVQEAPSLNTFPNGEQVTFRTMGTDSAEFNFAVECPHATMSIDGEFVYIDILYGGERVWEEPLSKPIPCKLSNLGNGDFGGISWTRKLAHKESNAYIVEQLINASIVEIAPRYKADHFAYCQSYKIALPTSSKDRVLTIVGNQRYRRGETIVLTAPSPDNEFNNKFLIYDFRTDKEENIPKPSSVNIPTRSTAPWQLPNAEYASFGGLPALIQLQFPGNSITSLEHFNAIEKYYKPVETWTDMDKIYLELLEVPETFYPLNTILPPGVFVVSSATNSRHHMRFTLDNKFGRGSRAELIDIPTKFGNSNYIAPTYSSYSDFGRHLLYTSFKEQLIGSGIKNEEGIIIKWNRITTSSFPIFGQLLR